LWEESEKRGGEEKQDKGKIIRKGGTKRTLEVGGGEKKGEPLRTTTPKGREKFAQGEGKRDTLNSGVIGQQLKRAEKTGSIAYRVEKQEGEKGKEQEYS